MLDKISLPEIRPIKHQLVLGYVILNSAETARTDHLELRGKKNK